MVVAQVAVTTPHQVKVVLAVLAVAVLTMPQ
jgi:hypothetical protein